jgi:general secretion pathway protein J
MTRRDTTNPVNGVLVVAWTQRDGQWLRWQSPPLVTRGQLDQAWQTADRWSQAPGDDERRFEVAIAPLQEWQIFYFRSDAWTNPQSSDAATPALAQPGLTPAAAAALAAQAVPAIPEGVRLVLVLPPGQALAGQITRDWARPTLGGGKS